MAKGQALGSIFGAAPRPPGAPSGVVALIRAVDRVEEAVEAETAAIAGRGLDADFAAFGNRKRQGLLEVERALRAAAAAGPRAEVRERLARLAAALDRNGAALGAQLRAAREIADILAQTLRDADSDGTYAPPAAGRA